MKHGWRVDESFAGKSGGRRLQSHAVANVEAVVENVRVRERDAVYGLKMSASVSMMQR